MKRHCLALLPALILPWSMTASAAGNAIGTDLIRWLDSDTASLVYQRALTRVSAVQLQFGYNDSNNISIGAGYKAYTGGYHSSVFYQAGGTVYGRQDDTNLGLSIEIGYERSPARNVVAFGSVKAEYQSLTEVFTYEPTRGVMLAF